MATTESPPGDHDLFEFPTSCAAPVPQPEAPVRVVPLVVSGVLALGLTWFVWAGYGAKAGVLLVLGLLLGLALFHSRFGFTSAWRQLIAVGNGQGLRAHTLLLGTAATLIALICGTGAGLFGSKPVPVGNVGPIGLALFAGATLFAIGMQLGGACASGTLFAVGSGQSAIVLTLGGFITGSVLYTWGYPLFEGWPQVPGLLLSDHVGWFGSWAITVVVLAAIVLVTRTVQKRRLPPPVDAVPTAHGFARVYRGAWPMLVGAVVLGVLAGAVYLVSGGIWGVTSAFSLWGAKILQVFGLHPEHWEFWRLKANAAVLSGPIWKDKTSLTDFGIMIGAAVAAAAAGAWKIHSSIPWRTAVAAILGGVLMGVGARLAGGCNIGAYLGGISVGSLHGWLWGIFALGGTWIGIRLRPLFGLGNPVPTDSVC
ncbi:YeeE/YedE family protein [Amycolatopsis sp. PS_44_ISF1]|uniref:YeeE/YedE family protein n=1 Tax=Amycolatopsis sp. PS_44_ISF1 TaxID=2974917 RepID=UPI0028DFC92F|nr:YeeE/YedE family protein [Amycolatopsis sp. PS_44_ISF1]MDT8911461.1 YeeE/YedE family protein [Amycolatopsis sp. PS_44_ISF1]